MPITIAGSGTDGVLTFTASNFSITIPAGDSSASKNFGFTGTVPLGDGIYGNDTITVTAAPPAASGLASASASFELSDSFTFVALRFAQKTAVTERTTVLARVGVKIFLSGRGIEGQPQSFSHQSISVDYTFSGAVIDVTSMSHTGTVEIPKDNGSSDCTDRPY